ncbi:kinase interacting family protein, putative [Medicago truncatula]|uniref:Kinase interacting family protein, putative n=1 Tax=Medicago truncatula TaxID=3880 RepID=A0A072V0G6_MEDTR|nr:kinase interacting family protein, putative [Medicago truncatula]
MAASGVNVAELELKSSKQMKRLELRKSHSWWWDSHISPKNSKQHFENLEGDVYPHVWHDILTLMAKDS